MNLLSFWQCTNYTVVCNQIANKSFVLLNASIVGEYCEKPSLRSASKAWRQDGVIGEDINKLLGGHKNFNTSNPRVWTKKQRSSSRNAMTFGVKTKKKVFISKYARIFTNFGVKTRTKKKHLHLKNCANFHELWGETTKKGSLLQNLQKTVLAHEFWGDNQYLRSLRPRTALQWHRASYFLWGTILVLGQKQ